MDQIFLQGLLLTDSTIRLATPLVTQVESR